MSRVSRCGVCYGEFFVGLAYGLQRYRMPRSGPGVAGCVGEVVSKPEMVPVRVEIEDNEWFDAAKTGLYLVGADRRSPQQRKGSTFPRNLQHHMLLHRKESPIYQDWRDFGLARTLPAATTDDVLCHYRGPLTDEKISELEASTNTTEDRIVHCTFDRRTVPGQDETDCIRRFRLLPNNPLDNTVLTYLGGQKQWRKSHAHDYSWFSLPTTKEYTVNNPPIVCAVCHSSSQFESGPPSTNYDKRYARLDQLVFSVNLSPSDSCWAYMPDWSKRLCGRCERLVTDQFQTWSTLWMPSPETPPKTRNQCPDPSPDHDAAAPAINNPPNILEQLVLDHTAIPTKEIAQLILSYTRVIFH